jgi:hypothetical protein
MAGTPAGKPAVAKADPRHPDTDKGGDLAEPVTGSAAEVDPAAYGFSKIDTEGVDAAQAEGPGTVDPVRVESVTGPKNSTFAERAAARRKVVTPATDGAELK